MQNLQTITIPQNKHSQIEPLQQLKGYEFLFEWTFLFEKKHSNIKGILEGIYFKCKWLPKLFFIRKYFVKFFTDNRGIHLSNSFSKNSSNILFCPFGEKIGIKFFINSKTNTLVSIISSTHSDMAITDEIELGRFNIPFSNIGTILQQKSVKNIIIKTNKKL